jgi:F-type H+-transporting ATPase subunit c
MKNLIILLILFLSTIGPSMVIAAVGFASINALGRNPSAAPKIMLAMIISLIFAEAIAIIALLVVFQVFTP